MYIASKDITDKTQMTMPPPFGPGLSKQQVEKAYSMDVAVSSFREDGDDYTLFIVKNELGETIKSVKVDNY